ncbi:hypothetical protein [Paenibacillus antibioticophila]|uniref:hypothetical protein n=1 Tax=Paenibacillus antibioticophila TaxID=1274374 RepID=UPI0005C7FC5A|nr:hypothetical protein [Paenibacillus antibioticophila]
MKKIVFVLLLALLGCQSSEPESAPAANQPKEDPAPLVQTTDTQDDFFSVQLSVPEQVKVNTIFNMEAELKNTADRTLEIMTGDPVFYYVIQDSDGNADPILRTSIGVVRPMKQDGVITEKHQYRFKTPGVYEVTAIAKFTLQSKDGKDQDYKLETERKQIEAVE